MSMVPPTLPISRHCAWFALALVAACGSPPPPAASETPAAVPAASAVTASAVADIAAPTSAAALTPSLADAWPMLVESLRERSPACLARGGATKASRLEVHRWTDAAGIVHYSDREPPRDARGLRTISMAKGSRVAVQASGYDTNLPDQLQQRAESDALAIERVMHDALGVAMPGGLSLRIVFVRSRQAYATLLGAPDLANSAGAYSTATKTIHVFMQASEDADFFVLRHEIVHALVHEAIGDLPVVVNEGLAEYFGRYRVVGMGGQVDLAGERAALQAAAPAGEGAEALVDLLAPEGVGFYAEAAGGKSTREARYRRAFAFVALLMGSQPGRATLSTLLAAQAAHPCEPVAVEQWLDGHYPGGLAAFAAAWARFMREPPAEIRAY